MCYSLIIPVYNEIKTLPVLLDQLKNLNSLIEIIIIDDGSNDGSQKILKNYCIGGEIILIKNNTNIGKGHSIIKGIELASGTNIVLADGDLEIDIRDIPNLIEKHKMLNSVPKESNVLVGVRENFNNPNITTIFDLGNKFINMVFNVLFIIIFRTIINFCFN